MAATTATVAEAVGVSAAAGELQEPLQEARLIDDGNNDRSQSSYVDYVRSRQPTYYEVWRQPDRRDVSQFRYESPTEGFWFMYAYYFAFLFLLLIAVIVYCVVEYTT